MSPDENPLIFSEEYYDLLKRIEQGHWWVRGQTRILARLVHWGLRRGPALDRVDVLDVGCGSGVGLSWAKRTLPVRRLAGVDVSAHGLAHCEPIGAELEQASATALPFAPESFDVVISTDLLQHVDDDMGCVREAARVLRPGGLYFVRTNARFGLARHGGNLRLYTRRRLLELLRGAGVVVERCSYTNVLGSLVAVLQERLGGAGAGAGADHAHGHEEAAAPGRDAGSPERPDEAGGGAPRAPRADERAGLRLRAREGGPGLADRLKEHGLAAEGLVIQRVPWTLPFGHSLVALVRKPCRSSLPEPTR